MTDCVTLTRGRGGGRKEEEEEEEEHRGTEKEGKMRRERREGD